MTDPTRAEARPLVSVVTVNFNGRDYLDGLLRSLQRQTYPNVEVLLVDNGSTDGSVEFVRRWFPDVRVIESGRNLGFTGGNNLGIREARGSYVALINNDAVATPGWIQHLVAEVESQPGTGAVGSKILFARPFVPVTVEIETRRPPGDGRDLGAFLAADTGFVDCSYQKLVFKSGFYGEESIEGRRGRWSGGRATFLVPVEDPASPGSLRVVLRGPGDGDLRPLRVWVGERPVGLLEVGPEWGELRLAVPADAIREAVFDLINNAASFLDDDGRAGDRGIFEPDQGQYDRAEDVASLCGCAMLLSREALQDVGAFDEDLFMYFEDTELSWRLRKGGYRLRYQPRSVVRHYHASTSGEGSPLFNFLVARNRVLMLVRHASLRPALLSYLEELGRLFKLVLSHRSLLHRDVRTRFRVQASLLGKIPRMWLKRVDWLPSRDRRSQTAKDDSLAILKEP